MSEHIHQTIADAERELQEYEEKSRDLKKFINRLCGMAKEPLRYADVDEPARGSSSPMRGDEFYGKQLAGVVRSILETRAQTGLGPATVNELYDTMLAGGYVFETKNVENAKRGLRISLAKNSQTFHKLPSGKFGLLSWYPAAKATPKDQSRNGTKEPESEKGKQEDE